MSPKLHNKYHNSTGQEQTGESLEKHGGHFSSIFDNLLEGVQILDHDWRYLYLNPAAERHNRRPNQDLLGKVYKDKWPGIEDTHVFSRIKRCLEERIPSQLENRFVYPDGMVGWFALSIHPVPEGVLIMSFDITEQVRAEMQVTQMKRLYATLSQVNQMIIRVKEPDELYKSICDVVVQHGEFSLAWIGLLDEDSGDVRPVAANGLDVTYWPFQLVNIKEGPLRDGLVAKSIRHSSVETSEDIQADARIQSLHSKFQELGYHSSAMVPFRLRGKTIGVLGLVSQKVGLFQAEEEVRLLDEMGMDISFALDTMDSERERKRTEIALRESETRFRSLVENSSDEISIIDADGKLLYESPSVNPMLGYQRGEFLGQDLFQLIHPDDVERIQARLAQLIQGPVLQPREQFRLRHQDGSWRWVEAVGTNLLSEPSVRGIVINYHDITERKHAEAAVRDSQARLASMIASTMDAIISLDADQRIILFNPAAEKMLGCPASEAIGQPLDRFIPARARDAHRQHVFAFGQSHQTTRTMGTFGPFTCLRANGEEFPAEITISQAEMDGQKIYTSILRDATERVRAQQAVLESERQMQALVTSLDDIIFEFDEHGTYLSIWTADESKLARPRDQIMGRTILEVLGEETGRPFVEAVKRVLFTGESENIEYPLEVLGGQRWFSAQISPIRTQESSHQTASMFVRDITGRKQAEREIQYRDEDLLIINALNEAANRGADIAEIANLFARETKDVFACHDVAIYLLSSDAKYIEMQNTTLSRKVTERIEKLIGRPIPKIQIPLREDGYFKKIMANENGTITSDPKVIQQWIEEFTETTFLPAIFRPAIRKLVPQIFKALNIESAISIPLISSGRTIGILDMSSQGQFTREDLQRVRSISYQMTVIIMRKQAEKQVQLQLQRMSALSEIDRAITSSLDMHLSLDILLSEVLSQLSVDAATVLLLNKSDLTLEYFAGKGFRRLGIRETRLHLGEGYAGKVGLDRKVHHISNLHKAGDQFTRVNLLKHEEFVEYFGVPLVAKGMLKGVLEIFHRSSLDPDPEWVNYLETLGGQAAIAIDNAQMFEDMQKSNLELVAAYDATIEGWSRAMDLRDKETENHTRRVTELTLKMADKLGISQQEQVQIRRGALLHDIGKLGVPDHILLKSGNLSKEEWAIMRQHPVYAFEMLSSIAYLRHALDIPYCHHEKWDGSGYPRGLKGEQIPLSARLFAVVDVWDALTSDRPYRPAWTREKALEFIVEQSGRQFDPMVVEVFLESISSAGTISTSPTTG